MYLSTNTILAHVPRSDTATGVSVTFFRISSRGFLFNIILADPKQIEMLGFFESAPISEMSMKERLRRRSVWQLLFVL
jgi:hypothetical protein